MSVLMSFVLKNLKENKRRTVSTLLGIILSVILVVITTAMMMSVIESLKQNERNKHGNYHVMISSLSKEKTRNLISHRGVSQSFYFQRLGTARIEAKKKEESIYKPYLEVFAYSKDTLGNYPISITSGRAPLKETEILLTTPFEEALEIPYQIGDKIKLTVGTRVDSLGNQLTENDLLYEISYSEYGIPHEKFLESQYLKEDIISTKTIEYEVVGIAEPIEGYQRGENVYFQAFTFQNTPGDENNIYLLLKNPKDYQAFIKELTTTLEIPWNTIQTTSYVDYFCWWKTETGVFYAVLLFILLLIGCASLVVIRNNFQISITDRYHEYGLLSSIGATGKQIRKSIFLEGLFLGSVSLPIGILLGLGFVYFLVRLVNHILKPILGEFLLFAFPWQALIIIIFSVFLIIFLSIYRPAKKLSSKNLLEILKNPEETTLSKRNLKASKFLSHFFGIEGEFTSKNWKRSKRKYKVTIVSLTVSVTLFLTINYALKVLASSYWDTIGIDHYGNYDMSINYLLESPVLVTKEAEEENVRFLKNWIQASKEVKEAAFVRQFTACVDRSLFQEEYLTLDDEVRGEGCKFIRIQALGEEEYERYQKEVGLKEIGAILINSGTIVKGKEKYLIPAILNLSKEDTLTVFKEDSKTNEEVEIAISKITKKMPVPYAKEQEGEFISPILVVPDSSFEQLETLLATPSKIQSVDIYVRGDSFPNLKEEIKKRNQKAGLSSNEEENRVGIYFSYEDIKGQKELVEAIVKLCAIFCYGFIGMVSLIGMTNVFNTLTTNMNYRRKEFAMLHSIGMTTKQRNRMVFLESVIYAFKSWVVGVFLGVGLCYILYSTQSSLKESAFEFPFGSILVALLFLLGMVFLTMHYSLKKMDQDNILEELRRENN